MASNDPSGLARQAIAAFLILAAFPASAVAQSNQQITICQATGSQSNPWVFTTIDARDLSEHLARGDFRANSIADCQGAGAQAPGSPTPQTAVSASQAQATVTPAAPVPATNTPAVARAATPVTVQQQGAGGGNLTSNASVSQAVNTATTTPPPPTEVPAPTSVSASAPAERSLEVAGAQATPEPQVSTLPKSGDEPDRPLLVLLLLGLIGAGAGLRRLGRRRPV
jgi:hypothetical protein